ncbi:MAG: maltokinase N-terminal cap-like domain-containing protein [Candidatus Dormibacteria bacterium]
MPNIVQLTEFWETLPGQLMDQRWFAGKHRRPVDARPTAVFTLRGELPALLIVLVDVEFGDGEIATYQLPLGIREAPASPPPPGSGIYFAFHEPAQGAAYAISDAIGDPELATDLVRALLEPTLVGGMPEGELTTRLLKGEVDRGNASATARTLSLEQSNSLVVFDERLILKMFRRIWPGVNPELQLLEALDRTGFEGIAQPWMAIEAQFGGEIHSLGMLQNYLRNGTDGFTMALTSLRDLEADLLPDADGELPSWERCERAVRGQGGSFVASARELGRLTAKMHLALANPDHRADLAPTLMTTAILKLAAQRIGRHLDLLLSDSDPRLEPLRVHRAGMRKLLQRMAGAATEGLAIRIHGDFHLAQLLRTDSGWHVLDFEGRPTVSIAERRALASPLQDVAGMLRSFDYAAAVALRQQARPEDATARTLAPYGRSWARIMREEFLGTYVEEMDGRGLVPSHPVAFASILPALEVGQALYEVDYELRSRPAWLTIPLEGIARLLHEAEL